jgi:hypothetical protein
MPIKDRTTCAVRECDAPISGYSNLCDSHRIPGAIVRMGDNTMIIAAWGGRTRARVRNCLPQ